MNAVLKGTWPALDQDGHEVGEPPMLIQGKVNYAVGFWIVVFVAQLVAVVARVLS